MLFDGYLRGEAQSSRKEEGQPRENSHHANNANTNKTFFVIYQRAELYASADICEIDTGPFQLTQNVSFNFFQPATTEIEPNPRSQQTHTPRTNPALPPQL